MGSRRGPPRLGAPAPDGPRAAPWTERETPPLAAAWLLAAIVLTHPAHAPAGLVLVFLAPPRAGPTSARMTYAAVIALAAGGLAAFWLVPLLAHLEMALPLAWGDASLAGLAAQIGTRPLSLALASALACWTTARRPCRA